MPGATKFLSTPLLLVDEELITKFNALILSDNASVMYKVQRESFIRQSLMETEKDRRNCAYPPDEVDETNDDTQIVIDSNDEDRQSSSDATESDDELITDDHEDSEDEEITCKIPTNNLIRTGTLLCYNGAGCQCHILHLVVSCIHQTSLCQKITKIVARIRRSKKIRNVIIMSMKENKLKYNWQTGFLVPAILKIRWWSFARALERVLLIINAIGRREFNSLVGIILTKNEAELVYLPLFGTGLFKSALFAPPPKYLGEWAKRALLKRPVPNNDKYTIG